MWPWLIFLSQEWLEWQLEQPDWAVQLQDDERFLTILVVLLCINSNSILCSASSTVLGCGCLKMLLLKLAAKDWLLWEDTLNWRKSAWRWMSPGTPCTQSFTCYCTNFGGSFGGVQSPNGSKALCAIHAKCARASLATSAGTVGELAHPAQWIAQSTCI